MRTSILHNDTEFIGNLNFLLSPKGIDILSADESVFDFVSISKGDNVLLCKILELEKYSIEIGKISEVQNSFNLMLKNSFGYMDSVFTVKRKSENNTELSVMLFISRENDTVFVAASLSADSIFRYSLSDKRLYLYANRDGEFSFVGCFDDFERYFYEHNIVYNDDLDLFKCFCQDVYEGRSSLEYILRLSNGSNNTFSTCTVKARTTHANDESVVMGLIVNDSKNGNKNINIFKYDFEKEITDFAFDLVDNATNADEAVKMLMSKIGRHLALKKVKIYEAEELPFSLKMTYCFSDNALVPPDNNIITTDQSDWELMLSAFKSKKIILAENISTSGLPVILKEICGNETVLLCSLYNGSKFSGILCCDGFSGDNNDDIHIMKTVRRIISSYLLKMRDYQKANITIDRLTNYDKLTGLPAIGKFRNIAEETLNLEARPDNLALICYDINNFKYINEKYGIEAGDRILKEFAEAIAPDKDETILSCRIFSDKFISLVRCPKERLEIKARTVTDSFVFSQKEKSLGYNLTFSCGLYIFNSFNTDIGTAMDNATTACKSCKNMVETACAFYDSSMTIGVTHELEMLNNAMKALINREFVIYYQPKVALENSKLVGGEALVRWKKPDGTMIPPNDFIPCLEKNGFITVLDFYVYEEVCKFIKNRLDNNQPVVPISVNVSMLHLKEEGFLDRIKGLVNSYQIPSDLLEFELTESVFLENQQAALEVMEKMKEMGFLVSIDDFGSGFSSLNMLKSLPVDILKIDKEFFSNHTLLNNDQIIISSIISMASRLHISVICEGVETVDQIHFLKGTSCDMVQGYFYSKPVSEDVFMDFNMHPDFRHAEE